MKVRISARAESDLDCIFAHIYLMIGTLDRTAWPVTIEPP
jgi:hypothetical protein